MLCLRTDQKKLYQLLDLGPTWKLLFDLSTGVGVAPQTAAMLGGWTPVQQGGGTGQDTSKIYIGWATNVLKLQVESTDYGSVWPIAISGNAATATNAAIAAEAVKLKSENWTVLESGGALLFQHGGVSKAKLDSGGNLIVVGNVTAFGTI